MNSPLHRVVEDLFLECGIHQREIIYADKLRSRSANNPLFITCISPRVKWMFIKAINSLSRNSSGVNTYARPYMTEESLRQDRELVRTLQDLRKSHSDRQFKIYRGHIHENISDNLVRYFKDVPNRPNNPTTSQPESNAQPEPGQPITEPINSQMTTDPDNQLNPTTDGPSNTASHTQMTTNPANQLTPHMHPISKTNEKHNQVDVPLS